MKKPAIVCLSILLLISFCQPVSASQTKSVKQLEQNKAKYEQNKKNAQNALNDAKSNEKNVMQEIYQLDESVSKAQAELDEVNQKLEETKSRLSESEKQLQTAKEKKELQLETFGKRLNFIHESGDLGYLQAVLKAQTLGDMLVRMQYVNDIMSYDKKTLDELRENQETIAVKTEEIKVERDKTVILAQEQQVKTKELTDKLSLKQQAAESYRKDAAKYEQELATWTSASNEVERLIKEAEEAKAAAARAAAAKSKSANQSSQGSSQNTVSTNTVYTGGQFTWPLPGRSRISSGYGYRSKPIGSGQEFHTGIDIPGPLGTDVVAAADGVVITSGYVRGFGNTIMIDHGGGLVTLYGHNSRLVASKGESVKKGQVVAKCGSTGNSTGNHVHFEVRKNGKHTNPMPYLGQ